MEERQFIDKPYVILVEGKLDEIIVRISLEYIRENFPDLKEKVSNTQIFNIKGKDKLNSAIVKQLIRKAQEIIKAILIILDKDDNYSSTEQKIQNFLKNFDWIKLTDYLIIPPHEMPGRELEDYLVNALEQTDAQKIQVLKECIARVSSNRKLGKKLFFTYLLVNDNCNYDGLSISKDILNSCVKVENLNSIIKKVKQFLQNAPS